MIEGRITKRLAEEGIRARSETDLAHAIVAEDAAELLARARDEMDDAERARHERLLREQDVLRQALGDVTRARRRRPGRSAPGSAGRSRTGRLPARRGSVWTPSIGSKPSASIPSIRPSRLRGLVGRL
ncbi:hypothetical protein ACU4GA_08970 [Methylobacterium oryzae CBMB20]